MDDIFDAFRKFMENNMPNFFNEKWDEFDVTELTDQNSQEDPTRKSYSISYKFGTGMDKPEIKVSGDLNENSIRNFLNNINLRGKTPEIDIANIVNQNQINPLPINGEDTIQSNQYSEPFTDILPEDEGVQIILEMPGVGKNDLKIEVQEKKLEIVAESEYYKYKKSISLDFIPEESMKIHSNNGIITIHIKKAK